METKNYATEINAANVGRLIQYYFDGVWRVGTLDGFAEDSIRVKKITGAALKRPLNRDDVRLVIQEPEKPQALAVPVGEVTPDVVSKVNATIAKAVASSKPKLFGGGIVAIDKAKKKSGKPEKVAKPKAAKKAAHKPAKKSKTAPPENVKFDVARIVKLYDRGKGKSVSEIAQAIGYPKNKGQNRVANALIKEGVFKGTRTQQ